MELLLSPVFQSQVFLRFIYADSMGPLQSMHLVDGYLGLCLVLRMLSYFPWQITCLYVGHLGQDLNLGVSLLRTSACLCNTGLYFWAAAPGEGTARFVFIHTCLCPTLTLSQASGWSIFCCCFYHCACLLSGIEYLSVSIIYISFSVYYIASLQFSLGYFVLLNL